MFLSTVARRPAVARLWCCARGSVIGGRRSACGGGRHRTQGPDRFPGPAPLLLAVPLIGGCLVLRDGGDGSPAHQLVHQFREPVARCISESKLEVVRSY